MILCNFRRILFFLSLICSNLLVARDFKIWTPNGPKTVNPTSYGKNVPIRDLEKAQLKKSYAYLVVREPVDSKKRKDLEKNFRFRFLGVHDIDSGNIIYRISFKRNIDSLKNELTNGMPIFVNVEAISSEDQMSSKLKKRSGFSEDVIDSLSGMIFANVQFYEDVSEFQSDSIITTFCGSWISKNNTGNYLIKNQVEVIRTLGALTEVRSVKELIMKSKVTNDVARELTGVNKIQKINYQQFPPDTSWMSNDSLTGDSIFVGVWDRGIDTLNQDFREKLPCTIPPFTCTSSVLRGYKNNGWESPNSNPIEHGTWVAGVIAGNGTNSEAAGGTRYQFRGVAPKAILIARPTRTQIDADGDVQNHSHTDDLNYNDYMDANTWQHNRVSPQTKIVVFAAGNSGQYPNVKDYGPQKGYYSLWATSKNPIVVANVHKNDTVRSIYSSMGPTRDGRIKPDISAPGSNGQRVANRNANYPLAVEIDYIRIKDSTGAIKYSWEFNDSAEGWGRTRIMLSRPDGNGNFDNTGSYEINSVIQKGSVLRFNSTSFESYIWSDSIRPIVRMGNHDSLDMRLRIIHPFGTDYSQPYLAGKIYWKRLNNLAYSSGGIPIIYRLTDSSTFFNVKQPLTGWTNNDTLLALRLDFAADTLGKGIITSNLTGSPSPNEYYTQTDGTSIAAPHVTGIIALMLDKYNRKYIHPPKSIHNNAFWNSTAKAILVHSAIDLIHQGDFREPGNPDILAHDPTHNAAVNYYEGPDYATGYGLVNAPGAIAHVDTNLFREDSVDYTQDVIYSFNMQSNVDKIRVTLAWDDLPGNPYAPIESPKLMNDLDLVLEDPNGSTYLPWTLEPLPQKIVLDSNGNSSLPPDGLDPIDSASVKPAYHGINKRDNLEVVDVKNTVLLPKGKWRVHVKGTRVLMGAQDFSLVGDYKLKRDTMVTAADSLKVKVNIGTTIKTSTAMRESDSTTFFGGGPNGDTLYSVSIKNKAVRWKYGRKNTSPISDPVLFGNKIIFRTIDSLFCVQDNGNAAILLWNKRLLPISSPPAIVVGDTSVRVDILGSLSSPAFDLPHQVVYLSANYSITKRVKVPNPPYSPWDSTLSNKFYSKMALYDANTGSEISPYGDGTFSQNLLDAGPTAAKDGGFFVDVTGRVYLMHFLGYYQGTSKNVPAKSYYNIPPILGSNNKLFLQSSSSVVVSNQTQGDSLTILNYQDKILSNVVVDAAGARAFLVGYNYVNNITYLIGYSVATGQPYVTYYLGTGLRAVGNLSLTNDNILYLTFESSLYRFQMFNGFTSGPPPDQFPINLISASSPNIGNKLLVIPSGPYLYGYNVTSTGLSSGWARTGKDNGNTGMQPAVQTQPVAWVAGHVYNVGDKVLYNNVIYTAIQSHTSQSSQPPPTIPAIWQSALTSTLWSQADVGTVGVKGSGYEVGSTITINGSGANIWNTDDGFRFAYQIATGDIDLRARVVSLQTGSGINPKSGIMIRENLNSNAKNAAMVITTGFGMEFLTRTGTGSYTTKSGGLAGNAPKWVRITRIGSNIKGYISDDGVTWTQVGSQSITFSNSIYVGMAVSSLNQSVSVQSTFDNANVSVPPPDATPLGTMTQQDIGYVGISGSSSLTNGVYTINAGGTNIWNTDDGFRFIYKAVTGNTDIKFRVASLPSISNGTPESGVMIRDSLTSNSKNVGLYVLTNNSLEFLVRSGTGSNTTYNGGVYGRAPKWVRLKRIGNLITSYSSDDGTNWTQVGSQTLAMNSTVYVGIAVCSNTPTQRVQSTIDNLSITP